MMPTIRYHKCLPLAINNYGEIVGHVQRTTMSTRSDGGREVNLIDADYPGAMG
jgi:hypothetical protein